uniref:Variant surface glycoprotein 1900 n=1 Tax=Trypanosoma brucei TaxID=5691 RepID=M4SZL9_9TRYP|nr:variant surface glycoprotein 1900 [Trypanosoma brucei]
MRKVNAAFTGTALFLAITILAYGADTETTKQSTACKSANYIQSLQKAIRQQPLLLLSEIKRKQTTRKMLEIASSVTDKENSRGAIALLAAVNKHLGILLDKTEQCSAKAAETAALLATQAGRHWAIAEATKIATTAADGDELADGGNPTNKYAELTIKGTDDTSCTDMQQSELKAQETTINLQGLEKPKRFQHRAKRRSRRQRQKNMPRRLHRNMRHNNQLATQNSEQTAAEREGSQKTGSESSRKGNCERTDESN